MVKREDIRKLNEQISTLIEAVDELEDLYEQSQKTGVTVDPAAYESAQADVKDAVEVLVNASDSMVDRTDVLEDAEGNALVQLPNAALARDGSSKTLPKK